MHMGVDEARGHRHALAVDHGVGGGGRAGVERHYAAVIDDNGVRLQRGLVEHTGENLADVVQYELHC